jgi:hypothetical protein
VGTPVGTPARGATPSVSATLEEEELRVRALMQAKQAEAEKGRRLEAARAVAQAGFSAARAAQCKRAHGPALPPEAAAGAAARQGGSDGGGGDLTAGLLDL